MGLFLCCLAIALLDSLLRGRWASEAMVLVPAHSDLSRLETRALDVAVNELFLATYVEALTSHEVLKRALSRSMGGKPLQDATVLEIEDCLSIHRLPFNNAVRIRLELDDPSKIEEILACLIEEYGACYRSHMIEEPLKTRTKLSEDRGRLEAELEEAEGRLTSFLVEGRGAFASDGLEAALKEREAIQRRLGRAAAEEEILRSKMDRLWRDFTERNEMAATDRDDIAREPRSELESCLYLLLNAEDLHGASSREVRESREETRSLEDQLQARFLEDLAARGLDSTDETVVAEVERLVASERGLIASRTERRYALDSRDRVLARVEELIATEEELRVLKREVSDLKGLLSQTLRSFWENEVTIAKLEHASILEISPPSSPRKVNPLDRNLVRGALAGAFLEVLLLYLLALGWRDHSP